MIDTGSYLGLTASGKFIVGYDNTIGIPGFGVGVSWVINHVTRTVAPTHNIFWGLCGDHASFIAPSDGRDYMVGADCDYNSETWLVDITNDASGLLDGSVASENKQRALPNNKLLKHWTAWVGNHFTAVARGPLRDWAFLSLEDGSDTFNSGTAAWTAY